MKSKDDGRVRRAVAWLCMLTAVAGYRGAPCLAQGRSEREYEKWVEELANANKPPPITPFKANFPPEYDFQSQLMALDAWDRLNSEAQYALPVLIKHLNDDRYCVTAETGEYWRNCDVGRVCRRIIEPRMRVHHHYMQDNKTPEAFGRIRSRFGGFAWQAAWDAAPKDRKPSLLELQLQGFDWAMQAQLASPQPDADEQAAALAWLRRRRDELARSARPIPCAAQLVEEFGFHIPHPSGSLDARDKSRRELEKAMRDEISKLASPNQPPEIDSGKVVFPRGYDRAAQEKVVGAMRNLNSHFVAAGIPLIGAVNDQRYCATLEISDGSPRNVTVGKMCCLLIAANINVYLPYVRPARDPDLLPLHVKPNPPDVIKWWSELYTDHLSDGRLTQLQHGAFLWAPQGEADRGGFRDKREKLIQVGYLERRANEFWSCQLPVAVDLLPGYRVVLPESGAKVKERR